MVCVSGGDIFIVFSPEFLLFMKGFLQYLVSEGSKKDLLKKYILLEGIDLVSKSELINIISTNPKYKDFLAIKSLYREFVWKYNYYEMSSCFKIRKSNYYINELDIFLDTDHKYFLIHGTLSIIMYIRSIIRYQGRILILNCDEKIYDILPSIIKKVQKWLDLVDRSPRRYELDLLNWKVGGNTRDVILRVCYIGEKR